MDGLVGTQVKSGLSRLVVCGILSSNAQPIRDVFFEAVNPIVSRNGRHIEPKLAAFPIASENLFTPVANDVGTEIRVGFRPVVELSAFKTTDRIHTSSIPVVFAHALMIEHLT